MCEPGEQPPDPAIRALESLAGIDTKPDNPLTVTYPSPTLLLQYPLLSASVRTLCDKSHWRTRASSSLTTTFKSLQLTFRTEGFIGVYRGAHVYFLHLAFRDAMRYLTDKSITIFEGKSALVPISVSTTARGKSLSDDLAEENIVAVNEAGVLSRKSYWCRLASKYLIDIVCYPLLFASTRYVIKYDASCTTQLRTCCEQEGWSALFNGLAFTLICTAMDEVMDWVLAWCVDYCAEGSELEVGDKLLLKASGSSVVSIFTSPLNYIALIQRCQSGTQGLLQPRPVKELVWTLPWKGAVHQFFLFGGVLALNARLIQMKMQLLNEAKLNEEE